MNIVVVGNADHNMGSLSVIKSTIQSLKGISHAHVSLLSAFPQIDSKQCEVKAFRYPGLLPGKFPRLKKILFLVQCTALAIMYRLLRVDTNWLNEVDKLKLLQAFSHADVVVFCGTDMISDTYGGFIPSLDIIKDISICTLLKKPVVLYGTQIGPFRRSLIGRISFFCTKLVLNKVNLITVRDELSLKTLREMRVNAPLIRVTADPAFLIQPAPFKRVRMILLAEGIDRKARPLIGINTSALIYRFLNGKNLKEKLENYVDLISRLASFIIENLDATVVLVSHVFGPGRKKDDRMMAEKIIERVGRKDKLKLLTKEYTPEELKGIIGQFDLLISTRMHPIIHAISMHTPVVGVDYTFKTTRLMKRVAQERYIHDISSLDYDKLMSNICNAYSRKDRIRETLKIRSRLLQKYALLNERLTIDLVHRVIHAKNLG